MYLGINLLYIWIFINGRVVFLYLIDKIILYIYNVVLSFGIVDNWIYIRFWVYVFLFYSEVFMYCFLY